MLRRQPTYIVDGKPEGGYTDVFEIICRDDPSRDYRYVPPGFSRSAGPTR